MILQLQTIMCWLKRKKKKRKKGAFSNIVVPKIVSKSTMGENKNRYNFTRK